MQLIVVEETGSAVFQVSVEANPPPTINWQFNGVDLVPADDQRILLASNGSLTLRNTVLADSGVYTVLADNSVGVGARLQVTLKVQPEMMPIQVR